MHATPPPQIATATHAPTTAVPTIRIVEGSSFDALVDALHDALADARRMHGVLSPVDVVVAHRAMGEWLQGELAARDGAIAHLRMLTPGRLLVDAGASRAGVRASVQQGLEALCAPDAAPSVVARAAAVRAFVERDGPDIERRALRIAELSARVTSTFASYDAHWPDAAQRLSSCGPAGAWQAELYARASSARALPVATSPSHAPLFVFDVAPIGHDAIRAAIARGAPIVVFARSAPDGAAAHAWHRHGALRALAPSRWIAHGAASSSSPAPAPTAKHARQATVARLDAPSLRRACEAIAARAWAWVRDDTRSPRVRFHECAVVVPTSMRDAALPILREVFEEAHDLPRVIWRQPLGGHNTVAALVRQLIELPATRMRRADVLAILGHPVVAQAFAEDLPEEWSTWLDAVGIFHGLDARSHDGTYLETEVAADWDQGLQRLALGAFVGAERSGDVQAVDGPRGAMLPEEIAQSSSSSLGLLLQLVRSLLADADFVRSARLPAAAWASLLSTFVATYVRPVDVGGQRVRAAVLRAIDGVATCGLVGEFGWEIARREVLGAIDGVHAHQGQHLQQGVVVGSPDELRGIPFRCVAVLGVQQGGFPSASRQDELDLRPDDDAHRPDDPRRRDSHALYEIVESTRDELCFVPIAHDPLTGESRELSLLVRDLEEHRRADAPTTLVPEVDLHLHRRVHAGEDDFAWAFPEADVERRIAAFGESMRVGGRALPDVRALSPAWRATLGVSALPPLPPRGDEIINVPVSRLVRFLEHPTRGYAEQRLDYRSDDEERDDLIDEPFESEFLVATSIRQEVLYSIAQRCTRDELADEAQRTRMLAATYDRTLARRRADGTLPVAFFLDVQRAIDLDELDGAVLAHLQEDAFSPPYRRVKWGQAAVFGPQQILELPPIDVDVPLEGTTRRVRIQGLGQLVTSDLTHLYRWNASVTTVRFWEVGKARKAGLSAWVEHLLLTCSGGEMARASLACGMACFARPFPLLSRSDAEMHLRLILQGLLEARTGYCCPSVALLQRWTELDDVEPWAGRLALLDELIPVVLDRVDRETYSPVRAVESLRRPTLHEFTSVRARYRAFVDAEAAVALPGSPSSDRASDDDIAEDT